MAKDKGSEFIQEINEHSQHNTNPYYWVNRVDNFIFAEWNARLALSVIEAVVLIVVTTIALIMTITSGNPPLYFFVGVLTLFTIISIVRALKWFTIRKQQKLAQQQQRKPKERKKKLPKRRKDYGRY